MSSSISLSHLRATVDSARTRRSPIPSGSVHRANKVHFVDLALSVSSDSDSESDSDNDSDDSFLSANSSQTSLSSSPVEMCKPLPFVASAANTKASRPRLDVSFLRRHQAQTKASASPLSAVAPYTPQRYLYQGGVTTVVTGGVMLGSPISAPSSPARSPKARSPVKKTGADSSSWRRL